LRDAGLLLHIERGNWRLRDLFGGRCCRAALK
jgi:hypothetical protein